MVPVADRFGRGLAAFLLGMLVLTSTEACKGRDDGAAAAAANPAAVEAVFGIQGMTCASCTVTVRTAATRVGGVYDARADVSEARAWVTYDSQRTDPAAIARAISEAGYAATPLAEGAASARPTN